MDTKANALDLFRLDGKTAIKGAVVSMTRDLATSWARYGIKM
jgi:NAD(P)-dependent dehydrogenase (short-subunit alcohol dehydrogenase family)